ncbi:MAG: fibronectin type III domain-containing protein, partial [Clostridia bacterium]|nr:fibronectin type III domain-containing protein [Clostridia bacterium]
GTLSYFELDEFDKLPDKVPDNSEKAAQMLIVEADDRNRVRIYPYDLITGNYFPIVHKIDVPSEPSTFTYTNARYRDAVNPYFDENAKITAEIGEASVKIEFDQAKIDKEYVNSYDIIIREDSTGSIVKQLSIWSEYYFYDMPATRSVTVKGLKKGTEYTAQVIANSFWSTSSENSLTLKFKTA